MNGTTNIKSAYQYQYGDRPLKGYRIERAAGRGGFGEVYYAVSDSGRQVALKAIQNYEQIELRGISQCMNLKSPHLVTIFDVKHNEQGKPFVIMEYVAGPSLRELIDDSPEGLGTQKAAFFLREIAKGLSFLHDFGIVHRDLKPGNIFYENGTVMIGDYGLSKAIQTGTHASQTITVGSVNYMAPEVGAGCYDRSIDIYALGILLYEMLTGQVPFFGATPSEILMKHLSDQPELENIPDPFARVIKRALAKDPQERYQSVQEMVEDVFGAEHIRNSVSQFSPESLSVVAERIGNKVQTPTPAPAKPQQQSPENIGQQLGEIGENIGRQASRIGDHIAARFTGRYAAHNERLATAMAADPLDRHQRRNLYIVTLLIVSLGAGLLISQHLGQGLQLSFLVFIMILGSSKGILWARWKLQPKLESEPGWIRRLYMGGAGLILCMLVSLLFWSPIMDNTEAPQTWFALGIVLCLLNWWNLSSPLRKDRVSLAWTIGIGFGGFVVASKTGGHPILAAAVLAGTMLGVQIASPFIPKDRRHKSGYPAVAPKIHTRKQWKHRQRTKPAAPTNTAPARPATQRTNRLVPSGVRLLWLIGAIIFLTTGLMPLIVVGVSHFQKDEFAIVVSLGIVGLLFSLFCLAKSLQKRFRGWYRYLVKPVMILLFLSIALTSAICLGNMRIGTEESIVVIFLMVLSSILFLVTLCIPARVIENIMGSPLLNPNIRATAMISPYKRIWALVLAAGLGLGIGGLHRFYVGKIASGVLWLITFGLFGIGQVIDVIMIAFGKFNDANGYPLVIWESADELKKNQPAGNPQAEQAPVSPAPETPIETPPSQEIPEETDSGNYFGDSETPFPTPYGPVADYDPFAWLFSFIGNTCLLVALVCGAFVALHIPGLIAAGLPDPSLAHELDEFFGYPNWPGLLERIGIWIAAAFVALAATFIVLARRKTSIIHIVRAVIGIGGLLSSLGLLSDSTTGNAYEPAVIEKFRNGQVGPALEMLFQRVREDQIIASLVIFVLSVVILAWPARSKPSYPLPDADPIEPGD